MSLRGRQAGARFLAPSVRFLVVTVGGACVALHAERIQGLQTVDEAGPPGPLTVQGLEYAYINLASRLRRPVDAEGSETRIILFSKGHMRGNIRASQIHGLKDIEVSEILPLPRQFRGEEQRWYQGMILFESSVALVLNPAWVLEDCAVSTGLGLETSQAGSSLVPLRGQL
jgi:CheW-like domain